MRERGRRQTPELESTHRRGTTFWEIVADLAASLLRRAAGAALWLPLGVLLHDQVCGVAPAGLLHAHAASSASASAAAAAAEPAAVALLASAPTPTTPTRRRRRPADAVLADEAVLVRRLTGPGAAPLRAGALVVFRAPSRDGAAPNRGRAVASVAAVAGDMVADAHGRLSFVGAGQVVLAPQPRDAGGGAEEGGGHADADERADAADGAEDGADAGAIAGGAGRDFGLLPLALVEGLAVAVVWPPAAARWLHAVR